MNKSSHAAPLQILALSMGLFLALHSHAVSDRPGRSQFIASLRTEMKELNRRQKAEMADLKASQKAARKDFENEIRGQRRACFDQSTRGSEKRTCVQEFLARRKSMLQIQNEEYRRRKGEQMARKKALEEEHQRRLREFDTGAVAPPSIPSPSASSPSN